jgi:hypothetical protein
MKDLLRRVFFCLLLPYAHWLEGTDTAILQLNRFYLKESKMNQKTIFLIILAFWAILLGAIPLRSQTEATPILLEYNSQTGLLAMSFSDNRVEIRNYISNQILATIQYTIPPEELSPFGGIFVMDMVFSPNGDSLAIVYGGFDNPSYILIVATTDGSLLHTFGTLNDVGSLVWHPSGDEIAAKVTNGFGSTYSVDLLVWELSSNSQIADVDMGLNRTALGLDWDSSGAKIVSAHFNNQIVLWDAINWQMLPIVFEPAERSILDVVWTNDDLHIVGVDDMGTLYVWDNITGLLQYQLPISPSPSIPSQYIIDANNDNHIAIVNDSSIAVWSLDGEPGYQIIPLSTPITDITWLSDTELMYVANNAVNIIDITSL